MKNLFNLIFISIGILSLFFKNIIILFAFFLLLFLFCLINKNIYVFLKNIEKLSSFCIALFISYIAIAVIKNSENIFFIYSMDAVNIILKIMIILLINSIARDNLYNIEIYKNFNILINIFSLLEQELFLILAKYPTGKEKVKNIDKIITEFIVSSLMKSVLSANNRTFYI